MLSLWHKLGQNPEIICGNAMVYQEIMPFFTSVISIAEGQASRLVLACVVKAWCTITCENAGHGSQI